MGPNEHLNIHMGPLTELREGYKIACIKQHVSFISIHFKQGFNKELCEFVYSNFYSTDKI